MPPGLRCDLQAVEKLTALTEAKAPARCASAGEARLTSERTVHSHRLLAGNPAISCGYRALRPEDLRPRLTTGLPLQCEASKSLKRPTGKCRPPRTSPYSDTALGGALPSATAPSIVHTCGASHFTESPGSDS